jgi:hypothetical protein
MMGDATTMEALLGMMIEIPLTRYCRWSVHEAEQLVCLLAL